jgi:hypothetical protein
MSALSFAATVSPLPLPDVLPCPRCDGELCRVQMLVRPHWVCPRGHGYQNPDVLRVELAACGRSMTR